jgi:hypothetical protein
MTNSLDLPTFLRRGHPDCIVKAATSLAEQAPRIEVAPSKPRMTAASKGRLAASIIAHVQKGHDTFGKLRKVLPASQDREIKSAIRYAMKWMPMLERRGTKRKPQMIRYQARLTLTGRTYSVVKYTQKGGQ